jgi:hypothetical protein
VKEPALHVKDFQTDKLGSVRPWLALDCAQKVEKLSEHAVSRAASEFSGTKFIL